MAEVARGQLSDRPFVRTLYTIAAKRFTGDFALQHDGAVSRISWHRGFVVAADVSGARGSLADRALAMFDITDATFVLTDSSSIEGDPDDRPVDPRWLIFRGLLDRYDDDRLERETAVLLHQPMQVKPDALPTLEHFGFEDQDQQLVKRLLSEPSTLDDLVHDVVDTRRARAVVYALLATDCLHLEGEARAQARAAAPRPASARHAAAPLQVSPRMTRAAVKPTGPRGRPASRSKPLNIDPTDGSVADRTGLRNLVSEKVQLMQRKASHFEMLGLPTNASPNKIRTVYFELAKQLHPDRIAKLDLGPLTKPAGQVFARLNEAFAVLGDDTKRRQYIKALETGGGRPMDAADEAKMMRLLDAEEKFKLGEMALRRSHFQQALADFEEAVELNPDEGEHHAMAAYARFMDARDKQAILPEVKRQFRTAIRLSPNNATCIYYRGKVAKELGDYPAAMYCFERTLELEPKHEPAFRERKLLRERLASAKR